MSPFESSRPSYLSTALKLWRSSLTSVSFGVEDVNCGDLASSFVFLLGLILPTLPSYMSRVDSSKCNVASVCLWVKEALAK